jgi:transcriptional regulator with XRE-family HTH domain
MISGKQVRMARAALGWGVRELAAAAKVNPNTVTRFEGGAGANTGTVRALQTALESAGVVFISPNGGGGGVRLRDRES